MALWRGAPLPDLETNEAVTGDLTSLRQRWLLALIEVGEAHLAAGDPEAAAGYAARALAGDPFLSGRTALPSARNRSPTISAAARAAARRAVTALRELRVQPELSTMILLRQVLPLRAAEAPALAS